MKSKFKNSWRSIVPLNMQGESAVKSCVLPRIKSASSSPGNIPVYLNVYDLTPINGYSYWAGVGVFHSGVEVHGVEYAFGAHDYPSSGVFEVEPKQCPGFRFRKSIFIGTTDLKPNQVKGFIEQQSTNYSGDSYHLVVKNCNHFSEDICYKLTGNLIPKWVNRLARIGSFCNPVLPKSLKATSARCDADDQYSDCEKKNLRSALSCFSSMSTRQREKEESISSLISDTDNRGCLPLWLSKHQRSKSLKEG